MGYEKIIEQVKHKEGKKKRMEKHNKPKEKDFGKSKKQCRRCGRTGRGVITKYDLNYCRQCFREIAEEIGFEQLK